MNLTLQAPRLPVCCSGPGTRRRFLRNAGLLAGAGVITSQTGTSFLQAARASTGGSINAGGNVVLVLSMRGGSDGLSLCVPYSEPFYGIARPRIAIPENTLLAKDGTFGLHPQFAPLMPMWNDGSFAVVNAVGLANPNRSHFAAMEEVEDADTGSPERRGWVNRLVGLDEQVSPIEATQIGSAIVPTSLYGEAPVLAFTDIDDMSLPGRDDPVGYDRRVKSLREAWKNDTTALGRGAESAIEVSKDFDGIAGGPGDPLNGAVYPDGDLGKSLADAARLIRADIGAEVITIDAGAWDMHVNVGDVGGGQLKQAVGELALGVKAFFQDIGPDIASRVTIVTISEFGRRVTENASGGLDHGWGNLMMLFGAGVKGGQYHGSWPGLSLVDLLDGDLKVTNDYRDVLAEVVGHRFDVDLSNVFPNFVRNPLGVMLPA